MPAPGLLVAGAAGGAGRTERAHGTVTRSRAAASGAGGSPPSAAAGSRASRGTERGFEQLDHVPGRVRDQDLLPARAGDDLVAEAHPFGAQPGHLAADVRHDEVDPVPAAGAGLST